MNSPDLLIIEKFKPQGFHISVDNRYEKLSLNTLVD